jgi:DNA topoisomerase VI subunit B
MAARAPRETSRRDKKPSGKRGAAHKISSTKPKPSGKKRKKAPQEEFLFEEIRPPATEPKLAEVETLSVIPTETTLAEPPSGKEPRASRKTRPAATAASMAKAQREISVSDFFTKNRHLLGFDNPVKALLTAVKEAVDNSLDACEEAGILPDIQVEIRELGEDRYRIAVQDNGPGIVAAQVPRVFGQLLYGSKFHRLRQSRGQQGIGISAAGMYGQLTTGKPVVIRSRIARAKPAHHLEIQIDTRRNAPVVVADKTVEWDGVDHGTRVEIELEATYRKGPKSVDAYLEQTALANPHLRLAYTPPKEEAVIYERAAAELPKEPLEIQPHPHGVELGMLMRMLSETKARNIKAFLTGEFSRVSPRVASEILKLAKIGESTSPRSVHRNDAEALYRAIGSTKLMAPPTNCLAPIGEELLLAALKRQFPVGFYAAATRSPAVYRGNPFQVEAALAYGGSLPADEPVTLYRFANRVPLLYQQGACSMTKAVLDTSWRNYQLQQPKGGLPLGPMVLLVNIASVWVPFTSESKEAIAHYPEILRELKLALQDCGRRLGVFIRRGARERDAERKRSYIEKYIPHVGIALREILGLSESEERKIVVTLKDTLERSRIP